MDDLKKLIDDNWEMLMDEIVLEIERDYPAMKSLVGQVMKLSKGKANPTVTKRLLVEWLIKQNFIE